MSYNYRIFTPFFPAKLQRVYILRSRSEWAPIDQNIDIKRYQYCLNDILVIFWSQADTKPKNT